MDIVIFLQNHNLFFLVYLFISLGMLVEGLLFALTVMFLISVGIVSPLPAVLSVAIGAVLEQWLLYYVGTRLKNFSKLSVYVNKIAGKLDEHIQKRALHTFLISKFVYGVHKAILIRSGMLRISLNNFWKASLVSTLFWLLVICAFSYYFSAYLVKFAKFSGWVNALPFILIVFFLLLEKFLGKYLKRWL